MDHATQVALLRRLFRFFDERTTELADTPYANPVGEYTSEDRLARERAVVLARMPLRRAPSILARSAIQLPHGPQRWHS